MSRRTNDQSSIQRAINAPVPLATESYSPISHEYILDTISDEIQADNGLTTTSPRLYSNLTGTQVVGFMGITHRGVETDPNFGLEMEIGFKNSYDKSMSVGLVAGARVMVCSNGVIHGDIISFKRKHTGSALTELGVKIKEMVAGLRIEFSKLALEVDIMKDYELTAKQKAEIMGVMYFEENMVTPNQLSIIKKEMVSSSNFQGNTLWDLYNNVTESLKISHPLHLIEDHIKLHKFMTGVVGIVPEEIAEAIDAIPTEEVSLV